MKGKVVLVVLLSALLFGCVGKPVVKSVKNRWGNVNRDYTEIITEIDVYNPNPFPLPIKDVLTEVYLNYMKVGEGKALQSEIKANSESKVVISTKINNSKIPEWWISHIRNGEKSNLMVKGYVVFDLKFTTFKLELPKIERVIKTDFLSGIKGEKETFNLGPFKVTANVENAKWGSVNEKHTQIIVFLNVKNENSVPIYVSKTHYVIDVNGIELGEGYNNVSMMIPPKTSKTVPIIFDIKTQKLKDWWVSHIKNGEKSVVLVKIKPYVEIGKHKYEFELAEMKFSFETHMLE